MSSSAFSRDRLSPGRKPYRRGAVWRGIAAPFVGVGVRLQSSDELKALPAPDDLRVLAQSLGVIAANCWLYLHYVRWGGDSDFVYGLGSMDGVPFGPLEESNFDKVKPAYVGLMAHLGISEGDALRFEPCTPGYWGTVGGAGQVSGE